MLLATDLDGTFLAGNIQQRLHLYRLLASHPDMQLAYVSGRSLEAILPLLDDPTLPQPDYILADVGASIHDGHTLQPITALQSRIDALWPGENRIMAQLGERPGLQRQKVPQQHRCSFYCDPATAADPHLQQQVSALGCDLLYSADQYLDVLPSGINKGSSLRQLVDWLQLDPETVLVAGDTLNDLSLFTAEFKGVCVAGSEPALLEQTSHLGRVLQAQETGCGGILQALSWFGFLGEQGIAAELPPPTRPGKADLVLVYHRLPYEEKWIDGKLKRQRPSSPNGIMPTLLSFFAQGEKGSWIAWAEQEDTDEPFETHTLVDARHYPGLTVARIPLSREQIDIFYKRFSKEAFWPTLHTFWERAEFREDHWQTFLDVNRLFAHQVAEEAAEGALVWLHDYNLWMVPRFLRELRPDLRLAFFHHTYFPSADVFNVLPWRREIIGSLLQCDLIGFHIPRQVENFVDAARGVLPLEVMERETCAPRFITYGCAVGLDEMTTRIQVHERSIRLGAFPVGLDVQRIRHLLQTSQVQKQMTTLRKQLGTQKILLSVERLDYTKGTLEKLLAWELLLEEHPEIQGKASLVCICVPAASEMTIYDELQVRIEQAVGRINGRFAQVGWTPIQFFFRPFPFEELMAWYAMADVMWITPLRDGLNLVCKEYVAVQGITAGRGVLVLSEFAGAAAELKGALLTNPHDIRDLVHQCYLALNLGSTEARSRLTSLFDIIKTHDLACWGNSFMAAARQPQPAPAAATLANTH